MHIIFSGERENLTLKTIEEELSKEVMGALLNVVVCCKLRFLHIYKGLDNADVQARYTETIRKARMLLLEKQQVLTDYIREE
jgi:hypothetical protein